MAVLHSDQTKQAAAHVRSKGAFEVKAMPGRSQRDAKLLNRVANNRDRRAYEELVAHYGPRLKAWLMKRGESGPTAEDVVQDVMVTVWRKAELFDPAKASFSTWAYRLIRNRWIDHKRKHDRMMPTEPNIISLAVDETTHSAHADLTFSEMSADVRQEVSLLPVEQKQIINLAFFDGMSHSEIAKRTGLPLGTVKSRIRLSLKKLQGRLKDFEEGWQ